MLSQLNFSNYKKTIYIAIAALLSSCSLFAQQHEINPVYANVLENVSGGNVTINFTTCNQATGEVYACGYFTGLPDFNLNKTPEMLFEASAGGYSAMFFAKYDANANLLWNKQLYGFGTVKNAKSIALDASGNLYLTGNFNSTLDFDPGVGSANLTSSLASDIFLAKYDSNGNYIWAKLIGGSGNDDAKSVAVNLSDGAIYLSGLFSSTVDFDPNAGVSAYTAIGGEDVFLAKYDSNGNYLWVNTMGGTSNDVANAVAIDASGNALITGGFQATVDFDPSAGIATYTATASYDIFLAKYDSNGNYIWAKKMGGTSVEFGNSIALDASNNAYITGYFYSTVDFDPSAATANLTSAGSGDIFLAKYDSNGNYTWAKNMGGTNVDAGYSIALDASNNAYVTGYFNGTADFDPSAATANLSSAGADDIFIAKYDVNGNYIEAVVVGGIESDIGNAVTVNKTNGNVFIVGGNSGALSSVIDLDPSAAVATYTKVAGARTVFISKYNSALLYQNASAAGGLSSGPGIVNGNLNAINTDATNNVYISGVYQINVDLDPTPARNLTLNSSSTGKPYFAKYDASGNLLLPISFSSSNSDTRNCFHAIDATGNIYLAFTGSGTTDFNPGPAVANVSGIGGSFNVFIAKYDASGSYLWAKAIGGASSSVWLTGITLDALSNIIITGYFWGTGSPDFNPNAGVASLTNSGGNDVFLAKYDSNGNYLWANAISSANNELANSVAIDASDNIYITGYFYGTLDFDPSPAVATYTSAGGPDIFLAKYDSNGNYIWTKNMGGTSSDVANSVAIDASNNAYITGYFYGTADFDPSATTINLVSNSFSSDIFLAKYDNNGNYLWAKKMGGTGSDVGNSVALDANSNAYVTGYFNGTVDFDPNAATVNLTSNGAGDIFLAKYDSNGNYVLAKNIGAANNDFGNGIATSNNGKNIYIGGTILNTVDFDPDPNTTFNKSAKYKTEMFFARYNYNYTAALHFDGTNDEATAAAGINLANRSFSISLWEKREANNRQDYFLSQGTASANNGLHLCYLNAANAGKVRFGFWSNDLDTPAYTDINTWHNWIFIT